MNKFDGFIKSLLDHKGLNDEAYEELFAEIKDYLTLSKNEYISKGYTHHESIKLALENFPKENYNIKTIAEDLPCKNTVNKLSLIRKINLILIMLTIFLAANAFMTIKNYSDISIIILNVLTLVINITIAYIYVIKAVHTNKSKELLNIYTFYFLLEKLVSFVSIFLLGTHSTFLIKSSFNIPCLIIYITLVMILLIKAKNLRVTKISKFNYWFNAKYLLSIIVSLLMMTLYFSIFSNNYYLKRALGNKLYLSTNNALYVSLNNTYIIPNIGLILLIFIILVTIYGLLKK